MRVLRPAARAARPGGAGRTDRPQLGPVLLVVLAGLVVVGFYLATYVVHRFRVPLGWDAPVYSWRTELAKAVGVSNLPSHLPPPGPVIPGRPGFVVVGGLLSSVLRIHPLRVAEILPGLMAAAGGLAAGAAVSIVLGRPRLQALVVSVGTGTSMFLVRAINVEGYQDNVLALAVLSAALTPVLLAVGDRRAVVPSAVLIGATGLAHWNVLEVGLAVVGLTAAVYLPAAVRAVMVEGRRPADTAAARLGLSGGAGAGLAVGTILGVLTAPLPSPRIDVGQFLGKVRRDLPAYRLPLTLGAAAVGSLALAGRASEGGEEAARSRAFLVLMLSWCEVTLLAFVGQWAFGRAIPGHRVLAICLAIPILGVLGLIWLGERAGRRWGPLGVVIVVAGLGVSAFLAQAEWSSYRPVVDPGQLTEGATAGRYLDAAGVSAGRPVVFVLDSRDADAWSDVWVAAHTLRAALRPDRIRQMYVFFGMPQDYLAEHPTTLAPGASAEPGGVSPSTYEGISAAYFGALISTYQREPVALVLASANPAFDQWVGTHPGSLAGPGVAVLRGPYLPRPLADGSNPAGAPSWLVLGGLAIAALGLLGAVGAGWVVALLEPWVGPADLVALAPAVGVAALLLGGVAPNRLGFTGGGWQAYLVVVVVGFSGWVLAVLRRRRVRAGAGPLTAEAGSPS